MSPDSLKSLALELGFSTARICRADEAWPAGERLAEFIADGHHGSMVWMEDTLERRQHPTAMWPDAKSAVVVGLNYGPEQDPLPLLERRSEGVVSVYAQNADYHDLLKKRLKHLARAFAEKTGQPVKVFVDTAPLMEKPLAEKAGVGWQGKHTNLVSREFGSWLFLGVMLTAAELEPDAPERDTCGSCRACLDICPTDAFPQPYRLDARRCISYLTIEHKGVIPVEFRAPMGNRIYGCDDCLAVCPWNKFAQTSNEMAFHPRPELKGPLLAELAALDDAGFRQVFTASPVKRIGRDRFVRNVMIAIGNSGDAGLIPSVEAALGDAAPAVRAMAVWALARLDDERARAASAAALDAETDADVRAEWRRLLSGAE
ncbi:tRNA epoxyqueuosine(34) reductase QueG [uncultured Maricaulis sp.]|uniref:tRNA epoxyqueuosine(34) reductase QueG n=1 Tax=uncultured Maricaulis sp. TaxID=174710 RepID=UPI0026275CFB|nr:tRNA epoxyqueuosine(34) reductase QueG [uncultured Maricaulis sp.]